MKIMKVMIKYHENFCIHYFLEEQWRLMYNITNEYYPILKIWAFQIPIVSIRHPDDLEVIYIK